MPQPKISVIVPVYNAEKTLRRCVDSILAQTFEDFELILINDGSKDQSGDICDEYAAKDSRVKTIHKTNGGVSSARNAGLNIARGEYVSFADSDDFVSSEWLFKFIDNIGEHDLCFQGIISIYKNGMSQLCTIGDICGTNLSKPIQNLTGGGILGLSQIKLFRHSIIREHRLRFIENIHWREDEIFVLQYMQFINSFIGINDGYYHYFVPSDSKSYKSSITDCAEFIGEALIQIFRGYPPIEICKQHMWTIRDYAVTQLKHNKSLSTSFIHTYSVFANTLQGESLSKKLLNFIIINSSKLGKTANFIIKAINKIKN